ncbi:SDR family NAD(P)-dependent oxidoreductase [Zhouia sp. PK063]|uniref:SDR family NAD(P)-dependent oxidoreductase n=1 Tax=Zhouia sp. PK063 TaxID=3373602 RepID=UPI003787F9B5
MKNLVLEAGKKVWFITGSSRGFGRVWTEAALERGDYVVATARKLESIASLNDLYGDKVLTLTLDVTKQDQVQEAVQKAYKHFGRFDVILNNAGYSLVATIEEANIEELRALYETNVWGSVSVIKAVLPILRSQGFGHILGTSSGLGHLAYPVIGYYCSSKWAFEAIYESLSKEITQFGLKVTIIEPGAYATEFGSPESIKFSNSLEVYAELKHLFVGGLKEMKQGNPTATPNAIFTVVDSETPPLRLFLGRYNLPEVKETYTKRMQEWEDWKTIAEAAQE